MQTLEGTAGLASRARPARLYKGTYDVISDTELCDVRANLGDDPETSWPNTAGVGTISLGRKQQIGVTQPGRLDLDENFTPNRHGNVNVLEIEAATERTQHKSLHL
jgi:hypothetical protein